MPLSTYLKEETIILGLEAETSADVITLLGKKLEEAGLVKDSFVQAALTREKTLPTGLPLGGEINAAIPHTDIEHVLKSGVAMATLVKPVTFQNMVLPTEAVEVRIAFLLALEEPHAQIEMLQEIAGVLQDPDLLETLMKSSSPSEVLEALGKTSA